MDTTTRQRLNQGHYLGAAGARARLIYQDEHGLIVFSAPSSRRLPQDWIELSRWCLRDGGHGSQQWRACLRWLQGRTQASTVVSYSDPSVGHDGALYRACGWLWAPTWHALRPPPTGGGMRAGKAQAAKHRWVYLLTPDERRAAALDLRDETLARRFPWAAYREPRWRRGRPQVDELAGAFRRWATATGMVTTPKRSAATEVVDPQLDLFSDKGA